MTLHLYMARKFALSVVGIFIAVLFLLTLFGSLELARRAGTEIDVSFLALLGLAALEAPAQALKAAPFIMLLATMWTYARLARSSELVVARASGLSAWGLAAPGLVGAALAGVVATTILNPIAATLVDKFDRLRVQVLGDDSKTLSVSAEGLWLRQGDQQTQSVISAAQSNADGSSLTDVVILLYEGGDTQVGRIDAEAATLEPGFWRLRNAVIRRFDPEDKRSLVRRRETAFFDLPTDLTPEQILDSFASPESISIWELPQFIATLESQGFSARRHILHLHASLAAPLVFVAMAMLGAAFSMRHARFGGLGMMALYATLAGFATYFVFDIARALGGSGVLPPAPAAWGPPAAAILLAAGLLLHFEDA